MAATHKLIQTYRLSTSQNTITFSSIPQTYTDLRVLVSARGTRTGTNRTYITVNLNGSSANQTTIRAIAYSSSSWVTDYASAGTDYLPMTCAGAAADTFSMGELYLPNYTNSTEYKSSNVTNGALDSVNTDHMVGVWGSLRTSTSAITSISFVPDSGDFAANTVFSLYGIKNS